MSFLALVSPPAVWKSLRETLTGAAFFQRSSNYISLYSTRVGDVID